LNKKSRKKAFKASQEFFLPILFVYSRHISGITAGRMTAAVRFRNQEQEL
jgi:hypothetical protein